MGVWNKMTIKEKRAMAAEKVRQECEAQGIDVMIEENEQRELGARLARWAVVH